MDHSKTASWDKCDMEKREGDRDRDLDSGEERTLTGVQRTRESGDQESAGSCYVIQSIKLLFNFGCIRPIQLTPLTLPYYPSAVFPA
jgi:hypothetical protein